VAATAASAAARPASKHRREPARASAGAGCIRWARSSGAAPFFYGAAHPFRQDHQIDVTHPSSGGERRAPGARPPGSIQGLQWVDLCPSASEQRKHGSHETGIRIALFRDRFVQPTIRWLKAPSTTAKERKPATVGIQRCDHNP
ncbi:hypothetical protein, partial [Methylobacterium sp. P5_C11]